MKHNFKLAKHSYEVLYTRGSHEKGLSAVPGIREDRYREILSLKLTGSERKRAI